MKSASASCRRSPTRVLDGIVCESRAMTARTAAGIQHHRMPGVKRLIAEPMYARGRERVLQGADARCGTSSAS